MSIYQFFIQNFCRTNPPLQKKFNQSSHHPHIKQDPKIMRTPQTHAHTHTHQPFPGVHPQGRPYRIIGTEGRSGQLGEFSRATMAGETTLATCRQDFGDDGLFWPFHTTPIRRGVGVNHDSTCISAPEAAGVCF